MNCCSADKVVFFLFPLLLFYDNQSSYHMRLYRKATAHYKKTNKQKKTTLLKMAASLSGVLRER